MKRINGTQNRLKVLVDIHVACDDNSHKEVLGQADTFAANIYHAFSI